MAKYLIAIYRPSGVNPATLLDGEMLRQIDTLNDEMAAAGIRLFVGGLQPVQTAISIVPQLTEQMQISEEPYLKESDYVDGFWVLDVTGREEAIAWGKKAALACRAAVEVRPFH